MFPQGSSGRGDYGEEMAKCSSEYTRLCKLRVDDVWVLMPIVDTNPHLEYHQL